MRHQEAGFRWAGTFQGLQDRNPGPEFRKFGPEKINNQYNILDRLKKKNEESKGTMMNSLFTILFSGQIMGKSQTKLNKKKDKEMDKINEAGGEMDSVKIKRVKYVEPDGKLGKALSGGL